MLKIIYVSQILFSLMLVQGTYAQDKSTVYLNLETVNSKVDSLLQSITKVKPDDKGASPYYILLSAYGDAKNYNLVILKIRMTKSVYDDRILKSREKLGYFYDNNVLVFVGNQSDPYVFFHKSHKKKAFSFGKIIEKKNDDALSNVSDMWHYGYIDGVFKINLLPKN